MKKSYFENCTTCEELKSTYRKLVKELHPDNNLDHDTTEEFKNMQEEFQEVFEILKGIHKNAKGETYEKATTETASAFMDLIEKLCRMEGCFVELIGSWIWITGNTKEHKEELKALNFKFSAKKKAWYFHEGEYHKFSKGTKSMNDIRAMYGSTVFTASEEKETANNERISGR